MLDSEFADYEVWVWNSSVEAVVGFRVKARSAMRARIAVRELHDSEMLARRVLRVWVEPTGTTGSLALATAPAPEHWEPL